MKYIALSFLIAFVFVSCKEDNESGTDNPNSKAIGDKIYTIEQGADQTGARGQFLEEYIKISITDFEGNPKTASFSFEFSDEEGSITQIYSSEEGEEDWLVYAWKLGCSEAVQTLTILINECGISRDGCVDITVFELTVNADQPPNGWVQACYDFDLNYNYMERFVVNGGELLAYTDYSIYFTEDASQNNWTNLSISRSLDEYNDVWFIDNSTMIHEDDHLLYVSENNGRTWRGLNLPGYYYDSRRATILDNGNYIGVVEDISSVYMSEDKGYNWSIMIDDIQDVTGSFSDVLSIASEGNKAYIITDDYKVIEHENGSSIVHEFPVGSWQSTSFENYYAIAEDNKIILMTYVSGSHWVVVLNLDTNTVESSLQLYDSFYLTRDMDDIYLISKDAFNTYYRYNGGSFSSKEFDLPNENNYGYYGHVTIFKGQPVYYSTSSGKLYYYND